MLRGHTTMEGHEKKCVEMYCELANKKTEQLNCTKSQLLAWMAKKLQGGGVGITSRIVKNMLKIVLKCLYLARNGRPDIHWSINKLARSVTKWT